MNLKILFFILIYYASISIFFLSIANISGAYYDGNYTVNLNDSGLTDSEIDTGGLFGTGVSFSRFALFISFGLGLPSSAPFWFAILWVTWETIFTIFVIGWFINSIWSG